MSTAPLKSRFPRRQRDNHAPIYERSLVSDADRRRPIVRWTLLVAQALVLFGLLLTGLGPLLWLAKSAISNSTDIAKSPLAIFPSGEVVWENIASAWGNANVGTHLWNTLIAAVGSVLVTLIICITAAYVLSNLRPKWGPVLNGAILAVLFIPYVVTLVPVYKVILDLPLVGGSLLNTFWAVWLPAGANAFSIVIVKRFFDSIPTELFEAARMDGAGPLRVLIAIVLPLSRPILGVVALLTLVASYKDFLWPSLVLRDQALQPISVALPFIAQRSTMGELMAAIFISVLVPIAVFLIFQKQFLSGISAASGIKG